MNDGFAVKLIEAVKELTAQVKRLSDNFEMSRIVEQENKQLEEAKSRPRP